MTNDQKELLGWGCGGCLLFVIASPFLLAALIFLSPAIIPISIGGGAALLVMYLKHNRVIK